MGKSTPSGQYNQGNPKSYPPAWNTHQCPKFWSTCRLKLRGVVKDMLTQSLLTNLPMCYFTHLVLLPTHQLRGKLTRKFKSGVSNPHMVKQKNLISQNELWRKYAPPLSNKLEEAFNSLFPIVHFCPHLGSRAKFPGECTHESHTSQADEWECPCCQSRRFRNIFGRYIDTIHQATQLPTELTGTKIKNRAYGFRRWGARLYFKLRRHPRVDREYYAEIEQRWCFEPDKKELVLLDEKRIGEYSAIV